MDNVRGALSAFKRVPPAAVVCFFFLIMGVDWIRLPARQWLGPDASAMSRLRTAPLEMARGAPPQPLSATALLKDDEHRRPALHHRLAAVHNPNSMTLQH